jgi:catechol 2,3-dioxygenase-like lactoylglutathione lyase family enzyme
MGKINLRRVYHIGIPVNDLERAKRFYVDVLGMRVYGPFTTKEDGKRDYRVSDDDVEVETVLFPVAINRFGPLD